jgi:hypothetical protein
MKRLVGWFLIILYPQSLFRLKVTLVWGSQYIFTRLDKGCIVLRICRVTVYYSQACIAIQLDRYQKDMGSV